MGESGAVRFTATAGGLCLLGTSAGANTFSLVSSNVPVAVLAVEGVHLLGYTERLYFAVPAGLQQFKLRVRGVGGETVRLNAYNPASEMVATCQTSLSRDQADIQVTVDAQDGQVWALELARADEGTLEDHLLYLDPALPPALSLHPAHVFGAGP